MSAVLDWLLEEDADNPGVRLFTLTDLLDHPGDAPEVAAARRAVMASGPAAAILAAQHPEGWWAQPGPGYNPKYRSTVWSLIYLAQLGADPTDPRVRAGGEYLLTQAIAANGAFAASGTPSGSVHCLAGNLAASLLDLGFGGDGRLRRALEVTARYVTGEGVAPAEEKDAPLRYYAGMCGPGFRCGANDKLPCAWGAVKVLHALARVPKDERSLLVQSALATAVDFLFSVDPATAGYPAGYSDKPSRSWFQFGFPVFYVTDLLQLVEALVEAGYGDDARLDNAYDLILSKRDPAGRWKMEYSYQGKTWADPEPKGQPSKWVTLRALRVLKQAGIEA